jgi:hypothetical protein
MPMSVAQRLREIIAALDRRAPQPLRSGEAAIAQDAALLRAKAIDGLEALRRP